jgi:hypothetical protein
MDAIGWAQDRSKAMTLWDIGVLKVYSALFGILAGAYFAPFVIRNVWWFLVPLVVLGARGGYRWFTAEAVRASTPTGS